MSDDRRWYCNCFSLCLISSSDTVNYITVAPQSFTSRIESFWSFLEMEEGREGSECRYTLPGILHFLQHEWSRFELERAQWEAEKAELQARIAFLQGERRGQENLKRDLIRTRSKIKCYTKSYLELLVHFGTLARLKTFRSATLVGLGYQIRVERALSIIGSIFKIRLI